MSGSASHEIPGEQPEHSCTMGLTQRRKFCGLKNQRPALLDSAQERAGARAGGEIIEPTAPCHQPSLRKKGVTPPILKIGTWRQGGLPSKHTGKRVGTSQDRWKSGQDPLKGPRHSKEQHLERVREPKPKPKPKTPPTAWRLLTQATRRVLHAREETTGDNGKREDADKLTPSRIRGRPGPRTASPNSAHTPRTPRENDKMRDRRQEGQQNNRKGGEGRGTEERRRAAREVRLSKGGGGRWRAKRGPRRGPGGRGQNAQGSRRRGSA